MPTIITTSPSRFDIPMFIDYLILQIYSANFDWPNNNYTVHRERSDTGKFRFTVWDAEGIGSGLLVLAYNAFEDMPTYWYCPQGTKRSCRDLYPKVLPRTQGQSQFQTAFCRPHSQAFPQRRRPDERPSASKVAGSLQQSISCFVVFSIPIFPITFVPAREPYVLLAFRN